MIFGAHIHGEEWIHPGGGTDNLAAGESVYLSKAPDGDIVSIAHQGDPAPGGGNFRIAWGPIVNNARQILFVGDLTAPPAVQQSQGLFLFNRHSTVAVVRPGDLLPGGGSLMNVGQYILSHHLNNRGQISFTAILSTGDEGVYVKSGSSIRLVAKTGMNIPGIGTVANFDSFGAGSDSGDSVMNERGQVVFFANLTNGGGAMVLATPKDEDDRSEEDR